MNATQKEACRLMNDNNLGAIVTKFGWTWVVDCLTNPEAAIEVVRILKDRK